MLPPLVLKYFLTALSGTPDVLESLLQKIPVESATWDFRPDPERFTLREVMAHLADWNPIFLGRLERTLAEEDPLLPDIDEGQIAIENDYAHSNPHDSLGRFREGRAELMAFLRTLEGSDWERTAQRPPLGNLTMEQLAIMILSHDGYHTQQVAQWLAK